MLQAPAHSPYDLQFQLFGFPFRIAWGFWVAAVVFGYGLVQGLDQAFAMLGPGISPGLLPLLMLWMLCMLVSIAIHELGHAWAFRWYGIESSIVLYHFGGLAIPRNTFNGRSTGSLSAKEDMVVAFAGPLLQIATAILLIAVMKISGYRVLETIPGPFDRLPGLSDGERFDSPGLFAMVTFYLFPSIMWAVLNLIPVWPLDGGRIAHAIVQMNGGGMSQSLMISVVVAGAMTLYGFQSGQQYMGILFLMLGFSSFQQLQQFGGWRY